jgi:DNA-binding NtrC family response regulator
MRARILIIAEASDKVALLTEALRSDGHTVVTGAAAEEIRCRLSEGAADLVVIDISAGPGAEHGFAESIKKDFPDLPIICITGSTPSDSAVAGPHETLISKPFRISHIEETIDKLLSTTPEDRSEFKPAILVVDDDEMFRNVLVRSLRLSGYDVRQADDARAALEMVKAGKIWAVIADINMPEIDGIGLMETIKKGWPQIPVILITGYYSSDEWSEKTDMSPDGFLMKPFKAQQINQLIETIARRQSQD